MRSPTGATTSSTSARRARPAPPRRSSPARWALPILGSYHTELAAYAGLRTSDPRLEDVARLAIGAFYGQCHRVLSPSTASDAVLREMGIADERIGRWDRGVDLSRFSPARRQADLLPGEITVLYAGRLTREKGADLLAEAFLQARTRDPRLHLVARRRRPRGARPARASRRARDVPRLAGGRRARGRLRQRRRLPLRQPHRHVRPGPARGAGQRAAGRRRRRGRAGEHRHRPHHRAPVPGRRRRAGRRRRRARGGACRARAARASAPCARCRSARGSARCSASPTATAARSIPSPSRRQASRAA